MLHLELSRHSGSIAGKPAVEPASAIGPRSHGQCGCGERTCSTGARVRRACGRFGDWSVTALQRDGVYPAAVVVARPVGESCPVLVDPLRFDRALLITPSASSSKRAASTKHGAGIYRRCWTPNLNKISQATLRLAVSYGRCSVTPRPNTSPNTSLRSCCVPIIPINKAEIG